jgi:signal transduction histidine kinase
MKLINITTRYYIILFLGVLALWSFAFYFIMKFEVYESSDEILYNRVQNVVKYFSTRPNEITNNALSDYQISELTIADNSNPPKDVYSDTLVYEPTDDEFDEYRKLSTTFQIGDRYFRIVVTRPRLESTEIFNTVTFTLLPLSLLMIVTLIVTARVMNARLWKPFYQVIDFLSAYRVDKNNKLSDLATSVDEFDKLIESIQSLVQRNALVFEQQKQFIENASHETQTPLAVIQSQMEILLQMPGLTDRQAEIIQAALKETDRLTKLNKTLLLLSKIDNQQFIDRTEVNLNELTRKLVTYFDEKKERLNLSVDIDDGNQVVRTNPMLVEVMIGNLIKNAFTHNIQNGSIKIRIGPTFFEVGNTGVPMPETDRMFERFSNRGMSTDSWGLGLPIVKKIIEVNDWEIRYEFTDTIHKFRVEF